MSTSSVGGSTQSGQGPRVILVAIDESPVRGPEEGHYIK